MTFSPAEIALHNAITDAVEASTGDHNLATRIADQVMTDALVPTPSMLRHLAEQFDSPDLEHVGVELHAPGSYGAAFFLRKIADDMERVA